MIDALDSRQLYNACDLDGLDFQTTAELESLDEILGQARALGALKFGVGIRHEGYNVYVMGSPGLGKHEAVRRVLDQHAVEAPPPPDWCYVNNFALPHKPRALRLPRGKGGELQRDMRNLIRNLLVRLPAAFEGDEYRVRAQEIKDDFKAREEQAMNAVGEHARALNVMLMRTPVGYTIAPMKDGEVLGPEDFDKLSDTEKHELEQHSSTVRDELRAAMEQIASWQRDHEQRVQALDEDVTRAVVDMLINETNGRYRGIEEIGEFLDEVRKDIVENSGEIRRFAAENKALPDASQRLTPFNRYFVNLLVDNSQAQGAPVVHEDHPTYQNLVGRIEHLAQLGTLLTDFTLIKSGALHRANGGYLVLDARKILQHAYAWDGLKRALRAHEVRIQSLEQMLSLGSTISLEPEPIALDVKVLLVGDRLLYYLLSQYDPEFPLLFKVQTDFSEDIERSADSSALYARLIAAVQRRERLAPLARGAVARLIEHAARRADDGEKLSLHMESLLDVMRESDYWARQAQRRTIEAGDVDRAIDERIHRGDQFRERVNESILRNIRLIQTDGSVVGQVNGLAVTEIGANRFGHPSRITATARLGAGKVVDIEREVELGGAIHSKGVMILSAFLASRFARTEPLSLSASLVFEQSYGGVEGDSASVAELCALLSALTGLGLRQDLAITGSVNQLGAVQAIGGVNEKIEGFFDICAARGLTGKQGVLIPEANVKHLMLRRDVVEAVAAGRFSVYAVGEVDQALELLTGVPAGVADADGSYPDDTVNGRAQQRLREFSRLRRAFDHAEDDDDAHH
ncbi:MAG: AAA family ATPase [Nevskiales bacterium]|nr:AAA family ATPase [Nevskiales bacterium]